MVFLVEAPSDEPIAPAMIRFDLQIMIHTPEDFPDIASSYKVYSELNQSTRISVSVSHIKADKSLQRLDENERKCFLYEKRSTKLMNVPTYRSNAENNCHSKCRLKTGLTMCNCTPYYFDVEGRRVDQFLPIC